jgi:hypothetical protein
MRVGGEEQRLVEHPVSESPESPFLLPGFWSIHPLGPPSRLTSPPSYNRFSSLIRSLPLQLDLGLVRFPQYSKDLVPSLNQYL